MGGVREVFIVGFCPVIVQILTLRRFIIGPRWNAVKENLPGWYFVGGHLDHVVDDG